MHVRHRAWAAFFEDRDVLRCPVAASAAPPHDQQGDRWDRTAIHVARLLEREFQPFVPPPGHE